MSVGASGAKLEGYNECKRLVGLVLELDWKSLESAAKKLDPSASSTKKLTAAIQKKDPKGSAKAVLAIAEDLDVAQYSSDGTGAPALVSQPVVNPYDPRLQNSETPGGYADEPKKEVQMKRKL